MKFHIFSECKCTLSLLEAILENLLGSYFDEISVKSKIMLHGEINTISDSVTSQTKLIFIDAHRLNSYEVNKFFINTKLRYKISIVLICDAKLKRYFTPFKYDAIIDKNLEVSEIKEEIILILKEIYKSDPHHHMVADSF